MKPDVTGEGDFVRLLLNAFADQDVIVGIGDDAAIIDIPGPLVTTTDTLIAGIDWHDGDSIDSIVHRAFTANLSDLAAMGATPHHVLMTLCWPVARSSELPVIVEAVRRQCTRHHVRLAGGDFSDSPVAMISIVANGVMEERQPLLRTGAKPGDRLFVSRPVGGASAGLNLSEQGWQFDGRAIPPEGTRPPRELVELAATLLRAHLAPEPEIELGIRLAESRAATSAIDISDGLSTDLSRLCVASGCGAVVEWERIPAVPDLPRYAAGLELDLRNSILHGGEEYALLFTSPLTESNLSELAGRPVYAIGAITADRAILLRDASGDERLEPLGWDHFSRS